MVPTKNRSNERFAAVGRLRKFVHTIQATYHNPTMAKYNLRDLIKSEWDKPNSGNSGKSLPERSYVVAGRVHWIETYSPSKCDRHSYYRYVWKERGRLRHRHIPGGNVDNPKAIALMEKVDLAIANGETAANIVAMIVKGDNRA